MMTKRLLTLKRSTIAFKFYINLFKKNVSKLDSEKESFLNSIALPNLTSKCFDVCESEITEKDLIAALKTMSNGKPPEHDGLGTLLGRFKILFH